MRLDGAQCSKILKDKKLPTGVGPSGKQLGIA